MGSIRQGVGMGCGFTIYRWFVGLVKLGIVAGIVGFLLWFHGVMHPEKTAKPAPHPVSVSSPAPTDR